MKVYILERGLYSAAYVVGVYASPERAMADHQPINPGDAHWEKIDEERWVFNGLYTDYADVTEYEVVVT